MSIESDKIQQLMDKYIAAMETGGRRIERVAVTAKQYAKLLSAANKGRTQHDKFSAVPRYQGKEVYIAN